jgi:hypothetical protein
MNRQRGTIVHEFYCTKCGERGIPVHRKKVSLEKQVIWKNYTVWLVVKETNHAECISASKYDSNMFFEE